MNTYTPVSILRSLVPRPTITMMFAGGAREARSRREEEALSVQIVDDEQRRDRPRHPSALRVAAGRPRLLCRSSSMMRRGIAFVVASRIRGRRARHKRHRNCGTGYLALCLLCVGLPACSGSRLPVQGSEAAKGSATIAPRDLNALRAQARALEGKVRKLDSALGRYYPGGPVILVDTSRSRISLMLGTRVIAEGTCSTGSGMELSDDAGKRTWTFDTPRGHFRVLSKVTNPVWYRPDWSYIEEGEPIPKNRAQRAEPNVLGDYAIAFGNGFFIHGTLYTRLLGANVTHGCIRVDDETLKKIYAAAQPGTPIWIF